MIEELYTPIRIRLLVLGNTCLTAYEAVCCGEPSDEQQKALEAVRKAFENVRTELDKYDTWVREHPMEHKQE